MTTVAAASLGDVPPRVRDRSAASDPRRTLSSGQVAAVALSVALGLVVAGYGLAGSYVTVSELAARRGVPLAGLVPAGIDGGLVAVVVLDLVLAWIGTPVGWLRQFVRVLSVAANAAGGWPDLIAVGLHSAAPLMLLAMVEAGRTVLLRRMGHASGTLRDPVPVVRWVLAPWRTWLLWRRMVLWQVTSYRQAVDTELDLRRAVALLRVRFGRGWRRRAPTDLVWMLRTGVDVRDACARVRVLAGCEQATAATAPPVGSAREAVRPGGGSDEHRPGTGSLPELPERAMSQGQLSQALQVNRQHWADTGRPVSAETLRKRLRIGAAQSRMLVRELRARDRATVCNAG